MFLEDVLRQPEDAANLLWALYYSRLAHYHMSALHS